MKELGKLRPWVVIGLLIGGFIWRTAWWILGALIFIDWASDRWRELLDAIRGKPERPTETQNDLSDRWSDSDDLIVELWHVANEEVKEPFRRLWRNQGLGLLAKDPRLSKQCGQPKQLQFSPQTMRELAPLASRAASEQQKGRQNEDEREQEGIDDFVELWYAADEEARERLRTRWRNQGLGLLAIFPGL